MHLIESLEFGGAEKVVVHLANKLSNEFKVSICLTKRRGALLSDLNDNIKTHFIDAGEGNNYRLPKKIADIIESENVNLLHSHDWGVFLEAAIAVRLVKNTRLIHTVHGRYTHYEPGWLSSIKIMLRHFLERQAATKTQAIVSVSDSIKHYIIEEIRIPAEKIQTIHNGIAGLVRTGDLNISQTINRIVESDKQRSSNAAPNNKMLRMVTVGRIAKIKNFPLLLKALQKALSQNANICLDIVGDGPELTNLIALSNELKISQQVRFLGFRKDIEAILNQNDLFVLSSHYEGISIAILEAMSLAMPVISTKVGGIPETVDDGKTGYLVAPDNIDELAGAILKFAGDSEKINAFGQNGQIKFQQNFQEEVVLNQYIKLYQLPL